MPKSFDVIVLGNYCLDFIFHDLGDLPVLGQEIVAGRFAMIPGAAYNTAVALRRLGLSVGWAGDFGDDDFSRLTVQRAKEEGLDTSLFVDHKRPMRRITVALSYPHERAFVAYYDPLPSVPAALKALGLAKARAVFIEGLYRGPLLDVGLSLIRGKRMKLIMDGNTSEEVTLRDPAVRKAIRSADVFLPNAREACQLAGTSDLDAALQALAGLCGCVVVKEGPNGARASQEGRIVHVPAIPVEPADTTGAGDCFNAGFIKAWLDGLPLKDCLRWGNIVGGLSTLSPGGTGRVTTVEDVERWLRR